VGLSKWGFPSGAFQVGLSTGAFELTARESKPIMMDFQSPVAFFGGSVAFNGYTVQQRRYHQPFRSTAIPFNEAE